jgi:integrase
MAVIVREKKTGSGEWWIFINHKGRRKSKKVGSKVAANKVAKGIEERLAKGDMGMVKEICPTLAVYGKKWLESPLREQTERTLIQYKDVFRLHIEPYIGNNRLDKIKKRDVKEFLAEIKNKKLSTSRNELILSVLSNILEDAVEDEFFNMNPCRKLRKYCENGAQIEINPLTPAEVQEMLANATQAEFEIYTAYLLAVRTGVRLGELLALKWSDVDFDAKTIQISKSYDYHLKKTGPTKNKKARTVSLTPVCVEALRKLRTQRKVTSISGLVFTRERGRRLNYRTLQLKLKDVAPRAIRFHDLRHTYATLRIAKGDNIVDVSKQLGHSKVSMTLDRYSHWMPGEYEGQVDELDNLHLSAPYTHPGEIEEGK